MPSVPTQLFKIGFVFYLFSFAAENIVNIPLLGNKLLLPECVFLIWAPIGVLAIAQNKAAWMPWLRSRGILDAAVLLYFLAVCASCVASGEVKALGEVIGAGYMITLYFLVSAFCFPRFQEMWALFLKTLVISGLIAAISGICLYAYSVWSGHLVGTSEYLRYPIIGDTLRAHGWIRNAAFLADLLIGSFFALFLLFRRMVIAPYQKALAVLLLFTCLLLTKEKAGLLFLLGMMWSAPVFFQISYTRLLKGWVIFGIGFILFTVHFLVYKDLSDHPFKQFEMVFPVTFHQTAYFIASTPYIDLKKAALIAFWEHPLFGVGGNCLMIFTDTLIARGAIIQPLCCAPHSTFFGALGELGLVGFTALIGLIVAASKRIRAVLEPPERTVAFVLVAYFCVSGINLDMMNIRHYWIWLAFLAIAKNKVKNEHT